MSSKVYTPKSTKNILTIGAYERDNFGDILFYMNTKLMLIDHNVTPSSIIFSDMNNYFSEVIYPYTYAMEQDYWDYIIVVGGEIGGVRVAEAISMSLAKKETEAILQLAPDIRNSTYNLLSGRRGHEPAYLPSPKNIGKTTRFIINSVGIANSQNDTDFETVYKAANILIVRDKHSALYCESKGISYRLAPDTIHVIKKNYAELKKIHGLEYTEVNKPYILVQFSKNFFSANGAEKIILAVKNAMKYMQCNVYFMAAGTANKHDDIASYEHVAREVNKNKSMYTANILYDRKALTIVEYISNAKLWIGTSLHGRVVACAFGVPRISLENKKVKIYAEYWDNQQPYNVGLNNLNDAIKSAVSVSENKLLQISQELEYLADKEITTIKSMVNA